MNRYVRRGSKGIALLDESSGFPRLHYVFDVSDTGVRRNSRDPEVWQFNDDLKQPVSEMLAATYGISGERVSQQLADVAGKLVADYWDNNGGDIRAIVDGSLLMDYDEAGVEMQFKSAAAISVTYTLLERCGFEPAGWFDKDDFRAIHEFSTPDSVYALGAAVSDMSREVLRQIERTVKTTIRRRNNERSQHEYEQQSELHADRGLSSPEPDPASAEDPAGQVRQAAPDVPEGASPGAVQHDAPEREPVPAPDGGGADGRKPDAADHAGTAEAEPGSEQRAASDGVGAAHEQPESTGRGTGDERADLQLSFFDVAIPTEAEQIESIDQVESEKSPSAFVLSQAEIENALRRGSNFEDTAYHNEELKSLTRYRFDKVRERAKLKQSVSRLVTILFPELEKLVPSLHIASVYALLSEYPGAKQISEIHLTKLTNLLATASKGRYGKDKAIQIRDAARTSIGSVMPAKFLELKHTIKLIRELTSEIDEIEVSIQKIMDELNPPILSIPGVGIQSAAMILAEIGDFSNFESPDKILAYAGCSPSTYQSGKLTNCYAHMEKRGSRYLRYALYNATKYVCHWNPVFAEYLAKKRAEGKHYNVALSHATKKLVRLIYALQKSGKAYLVAA
jgi:hypothetical protein